MGWEIMGLMGQIVEKDWGWERAAENIEWRAASQGQSRLKCGRSTVDFAKELGTSILDSGLPNKLLVHQNLVLINQPTVPSHQSLNASTFYLSQVDEHLE